MCPRFLQVRSTPFGRPLSSSPSPYPAVEVAVADFTGTEVYKKEGQTFLSVGPPPHRITTLILSLHSASLFSRSTLSIFTLAADEHANQNQTPPPIRLWHGCCFCFGHGEALRERQSEPPLNSDIQLWTMMLIVPWSTVRS